MFYALSKIEDHLAELLYSVSQFSPCTIVANEGENLYLNGIFQLSEFGIYNLAGPDWHKSLDVICDNLDQDICEWAHSLTGNSASSV